MPRDNEHHHRALVKFLGECGLSNDPLAHMGIDEQANNSRRRDLTIAFSAGWTEAQKWEATEAQRQGIAVQAMNGLLAGYPQSEDIDTTNVAEFSYTMADSMIDAAKKSDLDATIEPVLYEGGMRVTGEHLAQRIVALEKAIQYAIDNWQSTFDYDTWIDLCRAGR